MEEPNGMKTLTFSSLRGPPPLTQPKQGPPTLQVEEEEEANEYQTPSKGGPVGTSWCCRHVKQQQQQHLALPCARLHLCSNADGERGRPVAKEVHVFG